MNQNPFMNDTYFKEVCNSHFKEIECKPFMLRSANENSLGEMSIPEPMIIDARQDMDENEYRACSMLVNVCKHMIQKTLTDTAEKNNIDAAKALKDMDLWVKGFVDFPLPFFTFESMQEQEYKNDDFCLSANADVIEQIVNIDGVPSLKRAVISALKSSGEKVIEKDSQSEENHVTEEDSKGGSRSSDDQSVNHTSVYEQKSDGTQTPYVSKEMTPEIEGMVIAADGGDNPVVVKNLTEAVQALFGVDAHKIKIMKRTNV